MSNTQMVLFAVGPDRPGLVREISSVIHKSGANLEDSRMAILAGDFALIILFSGSPESMKQIQNECRSLEKKLDFQISFKPATGSPEDKDHSLYDFQATGVDQPGIVHAVSSIFADFKINVVSFESKLTHAAFHGTSLFTLRAEIEVREPTILNKLKENLDRACEQLDLMYDFTPITKR